MKNCTPKPPWTAPTLSVIPVTRTQFGTLPGHDGIGGHSGS